MNHNIQVEDGLTLINVEIAREEFMPDVEQDLKKMARYAQMPGFRPGHVPIEIIRKRFGDNTVIEIVLSIFDKYFYEVIDSYEMKIWGRPIINIERGAGYNNTEDVLLIAKVLVIPDNPQIPILSPEYPPFIRYDVSVDDKEVDDTILNIRKNYLLPEFFHEGPIQKDDKIYICIEQGELEDTHSETTNEKLLFWKWLTDEAQQELLALNIGELIHWDDYYAHFIPDAHSVVSIDRLADDTEQPVAVSFKVVKVQRLSDNVDESYIDRYSEVGATSEEELKIEIKTRYTHDYKVLANSMLVNHILKHLYKFKLPIPDIFIENTISHLISEKRLRKLKPYEKQEIAEDIKREYLMTTLEKVAQIDIKDEDVRYYVMQQMKQKLENEGYGFMATPSFLEASIDKDWEKIKKEGVAKAALRERKIGYWLIGKVSIVEENISSGDFRAILMSRDAKIDSEETMNSSQQQEANIETLELNENE